MGKTLTAQDELLDLIYDRSAKVIFDLLNQIAIAKWRDDTEKEKLLLNEFADLISSTRGYADMLGRRRVLLRMQKFLKFTEPESVNPIIPKIPFQEAIDDLVSRMPVLARSAEEIRQVYATEHAFAAVRSTSLKLTERIQEALAKAIGEGKPVTEASELISRIGDWNYAYASVVYRTNLNTSYHAGQFRIMKDPEVREIVPAFKFVAVMDADVRKNHRAMHGVIASIDSRIWQFCSPPMGYRCRCSLVTIDVMELKRMGINPFRIPEPKIPAGAFPDYPSFGKRPDWDLYGAF